MKHKIETHLVVATILMIGLLFYTYQSTTAASNISPPAPIANTETPDFYFTLSSSNLTIDKAGQVQATGLTQTLPTPGVPALPYYTTYVALPPEADIHITVTETDIRQYESVTVASVPQATTLSNDTLFQTAANLIHSPYQDRAIYNKDASYPAVNFTLSEPQYWRDQRLVQLSLYPVRYNPAAQQLSHAQTLDVTINFTGIAPQTAWYPAPKIDTSAQPSVSPFILNAQQASQWRSLPRTLTTPNSLLPIAVQTFKIEINQDGLYDLTYADLQAAGMDVDNIDPTTFEMMTQGQPVSYQFVGDTDTQFEPNEAVRFYGWAFSGSRIEKQHVINNVFWLWAGGTPSLIATEANTTTYPIRTSFPDSITVEPENYWFAGWHDDWHLYPNEPDAYYWDYFNLANGDPITKSYHIDLLDPAPSGPNATVTAEFSGRSYTLRQTAVAKSASHVGPQTTWDSYENVNVTASIPITTLIDGSNEFLILHDPVNYWPDRFYLNRISVDYERQTQAVNDMLIVQDNGGQRTYQVRDFSNDTALVWHITDPHHPIAIPAQIDGSGPYTTTFGSDNVIGSDAFVVIAETAVLSPLNITAYTPNNITPTAGADWIAIAHHTLITESHRLAHHRQQPLYGGLSTHIVDVEEVINQYGAGLPIPTAIDDYLLHALMTWPTPPTYATLIGDASTNPRALTLLNLGNAPQEMVPTHLSFVDRFQGQVPSDPQFTFLIGADFIPDISIARLPAQTETELANMIDKIITFEQNQLSPTDWMNHILFVADNTDSGGNFCVENQLTSNLIPTTLDQTHLCLPQNTATETEALRDAMYETINMTGTLILNYRGHGSIDRWASSPYITQSAHTNLWNNSDKPLLLLSADCLDGYFTFPTRNGLGETFLGIDNAGTAAHWSSSGLGFSIEHSYLHEGFYEGLFDKGIITLGDIIDYAKARYLGLGYGHESEVKTFTLLGDPAMRLMRPDLSLEKTTTASEVSPGQTISFTLSVQNSNIYPTYAIVTDTLPASLTYLAATASLPITTTVANNQLTIHLQQPLGWQESATITVTATVTPTMSDPFATNSAHVGGTHLDYNLTNQSDFAIIPMVGCPTIAPVAPLTAIQTTGNNTQISWSDHGNNASYHLHQATTPYPAIWSLLANLNENTVTYTDETLATQNEFYHVEARNCDGSQTAVSQTSGRFTFTLQN